MMLERIAPAAMLGPGARLGKEMRILVFHRRPHIGNRRPGLQQPTTSIIAYHLLDRLCNRHCVFHSTRGEHFGEY